MKPLISICLLLCTLAALPAHAQGKDEKAAQQPDRPPIYKLDISVYELQEGKRTNARKYIMFVKGGGPSSSIKVGNRVPVTTGSATLAGTPQIQYMDVGLNFKFRDIIERDGMVSFNTDFELASLTVPERSTEAAPQNPVVRQLREDGVALIPLGKPSVVLSIEDTNSPRTVQLEVTATKL